MGKVSASRMPKRYTITQISVPMKVVVATKRKKWVPERMAGEARAMQRMPNICKKKTLDTQKCRGLYVV